MAIITRLITIASVGSAVFVGVGAIISDRTDIACIGKAIFIFVIVIIGVLACVACIGNTVLILIKAIVALSTYVVLVTHPVTVIIQTVGIRIGRVRIGRVRIGLNRIGLNVFDRFRAVGPRIRFILKPIGQFDGSNIFRALHSGIIHLGIGIFGATREDERSDGQEAQKRGSKTELAHIGMFHTTLFEVWFEVSDLIIGNEQPGCQHVRQIGYGE